MASKKRSLSKIAIEARCKFKCFTLVKYLKISSLGCHKFIGMVEAPNIAGCANANTNCLRTVVMTGAVQALPVKRNSALLPKNFANSGLKPCKLRCSTGCKQRERTMWPEELITNTHSISLPVLSVHMFPSALTELPNDMLGSRSIGKQ